ncbi:hypothetical protein Q1695_003559 [Nippostrongylus brasiliensis]|nr:hypothetical protein Q1695_003559 [Nippostrongylus brasiliensis]
MTISKLIYLLVVAFGSSTWIGTNSVWMQLSIFTSELPEGWNLPSYLTVVVQIACIGPLIYTIVHKGCKSVEISHTRLIFAFLALACACQLGLVCFWNDTVSIGSKRYSLALYLLLFGTSAYTCDGDVPHYSPPRFSASIFFLVIFFSTCISAGAFLTLYMLAVKEKRAERLEESATSDETTTETGTSEGEQNSPVWVDGQLLSKTSFLLILLIVSIVNAQMNGIIPSISSYAALPYSQTTYHLSIALSNIVMPLASFLSFFVVIRELFFLGVLSAISTCSTAFLVYLAVLSPSMIFNSKTGGGALSISVSLLAAGLHSYLRVAFASRLREGDRSESRLFWCGVFTQIGSFVGSMVMLIVNLNQVFHSAPPCR